MRTREAQLIADALVVTIGDDALTMWREAGFLSREWAVYKRLGPRYGAVVLVTGGGRADLDVGAELARDGGVPVRVVCNEEGLEKAEFAAGLGRRLVEAVGGAATVVVKTNQMTDGAPALAIAGALRAAGKRVGVVARGGYHWSRFMAWEAGPHSARAVEAAGREGELCRGADVVVGTTRRMVEDLAWRHALSPDRFRTVPNYLPESVRPDADAARDEATVLFAGRLEPQKRVDVLIDAVAEMREPWRGRVRLEIIGEGSLESQLRERVAAEGLEGRVTFTRRVPHGELVEKLRSCAAYVQASAYEGHPKTVLEAMGVGTPVIVADSPGLAEVVEAGVTGLVVPGTPEGFGAGIARLLDEPLRRRAMGEAAALAAQRFCLDAVTPLEVAAHLEAMRRAGAHAAWAAGAVRWDADLLNADEGAAGEAWGRSLQGFARRLAQPKRSRFVMAMDGAVDRVQNLAAMDAGGGVHPKHRLMRYHDFFVERVRAGEKVLDLGCGYAEVAASIAERGGGGAGVRVTGMDWSEESLAQAREMAARRGISGRLELVRGDITRDRAPGKFDVVVLSNVLEHLKDREELLRKYVEWYSPRTVLIRVPAIDRDWKTAWKRDLGIDHRCDDTHETEYTEAQLRAEVGAAGMGVRELVVRWGEYWAACEAAAA